MESKGMVRPCFVWKMYSDNSGEIIGMFRYWDDAKRLLKNAKVEDYFIGSDIEKAPFLIACDTYDASLEIKRFTND